MGSSDDSKPNLNKSQVCCSYLSPLLSKSTGFGRESGQHCDGCWKEKCQRTLLRAPVTSFMVRKYLIEEDCQNTEIALKGSENLLKALVLFLKNIVPFFLCAVKLTLQKM